MKKNILPTLESIAKELDISISTVSRVLNGKSKKYRISKNTTESILKTAKKHNYQPNQLGSKFKIKLFTVHRFNNSGMSQIHFLLRLSDILRK